MKTLFAIRNAIVSFYKHFNLSILMIAKAVGYFLLFHYVANMDGFAAGLSFNRLPVQVVLAILSAILPTRIGVFLAILLGLLNVWQVSMIGTAVAALLFLCVYIMTARMFPDHVYMLVLVPLMMHFRVYLLLPVLAGLYIGVIAIVPMILGVIFYLLLEQLPTMMAMTMPEEMGDLPNLLSELFSTLFDKVIGNDKLILFIILYTLVVLVVSILRKLDLKYDAYVAIAVGVLEGAVCLVFGRITFDLSFRTITIVLNVIGSGVVLVVIEFMHEVLDYEAVQRLTFEDDDYEYHVTVIPKIGSGLEDNDDLLRVEEDEAIRRQDTSSHHRKNTESQYSTARNNAVRNAAAASAAAQYSAEQQHKAASQSAVSQQSAHHMQQGQTENRNAQRTSEARQSQRTPDARNAERTSYNNSSSSNQTAQHGTQSQRVRQDAPRTGQRTASTSEQPSSRSQTTASPYHQPTKYQPTRKDTAPTQTDQSKNREEDSFIDSFFE